MKRLAVVLFGAMFLMVATAGSALADDLGRKAYTWPAHCNTTLVLYVHTWNAGGLSNLADARVDISTCGGAQAVAVNFDYLALYRNRRDHGVDNITRIAYMGPWNVSLPHSNPINSTPDVGCNNQFNDTISLGDDVWANAKYQITWAGGTKTSVRNDNSFATTILGGGQCN